ncbi:MAG: hypothetical protein COA33_008990 [Fluviicola sp.]|nr:hypothetical protein [Fluviicola sp.]
MEVLNCDYRIENIKNVSKIEVPEGSLLLWVWHADKIPPHIGLSKNGEYYSLKANGKDQKIAIEKIESIILKKNIKTLCFELNSEVNLDEITDIYNKFSQTIPFQVTCLDPIKEILNLPLASKLTDLLSALYATNSIKNVYGFNIDAQFSGIKNYFTSDIHDRLMKLQ